MKSPYKTLEEELQNLKEKIKILRKELRVKDRLLQEYEREWALKLFNDLETICNEYSALLNPAAVIIKGSYKNKGYLFEIKPDNVIGLFSKGRTKLLLLNGPIPSQGSAELVTDIVYVEQGFPELILLLDRSNFHFCQINRSCFVNMKYYNLITNKIVTTEINNKLSAPYTNIIITKAHKQEFVIRKKTYQHISSLQKDQLRDILQFIIKGVSSFRA